jgi:Zn-finger nucleic acid-binding protein
MKHTCPKSGHELRAMPRGAFQCPGCGGMFVPRMLVELVSEPTDAPTQPRDHDAETGRCPIDGSIMTRAEIALDAESAPIHLERCGSCRGVWFDAGEWSALAQHHLLERIDEFWTVEWRTKQRRERNEANYDRRLREEFGEELYNALLEIAQKIKGHARRSQALAFLREASDDSA